MGHINASRTSRGVESFQVDGDGHGRALETRPTIGAPAEIRIQSYVSIRNKLFGRTQST